MRMPPHPVENQNSSLLSTEENFQVFKLLGNRCQTISTTVVQLFTTVAPHHAQWVKRGTGVLCFVRDNSKKNYFFRLFSLKRNQMMWEHEMYNNMEYVEGAPFFHSFEGEEGIIGFNFANQSEAKSFRAVVDQKIIMKRRKEEKKARQTAQSQSLRLPQQRNFDFSTKHERSKEKRKRNITKADIGTPMDFVHLSHVGFKSGGMGLEGFGETTEDPNLKSIFEKAGVSEKQLQDKETMEFIYDFIDKHRNSEQNRSLPTVPPRGAPRPPSVTPRPAPPPPPTDRRPSPLETNNSWSRKPCPPSPPRQPNTVVNNIVGGPAPPPPPPPPPLAMDNAPPPPPMNGMPSPTMESDGNAALLESIRNGAKLKHVEESRPAPVDDARGNLLCEIRKGISLKKVDEREIRPLDPSPTNTGGIDLAVALRMALEKRALHTCPSEDDDDDSSTSNDDEWD